MDIDGSIDTKTNIENFHAYAFTYMKRRKNEECFSSMHQANSDRLVLSQQKQNIMEEKLISVV